MTHFYEVTFYLLLCLIPAIFASGLHSALRALGQLQGKEALKNKNLFPLFFLFKSPRPGQFWEFSLFSIQVTKAFYYLVFGFVSFYFLFVYEAVDTPDHVERLKTFSFYFSSFLEILIIITCSLCTDLFSSLFTEKSPNKALSILAVPTSILMLPCLPFILLYTKAKLLFSPKEQAVEKLPFRLKDKLYEYINESDLGRYLEKGEIQLMHTMISFKERIVREIMVPRIDIFRLPSSTPIQEAASCFASEGYSRIPIYQENVDKIIGILLHKDVLSFYNQFIENKEPEESLNQTIEHLVKPVLYTPETKKISGLLQEFRNKQTHLAIVVDEYGGTEGIVTIEDILEELVGEIEDEYDIHEEKIFSALSSGGWIVDAKMSIIDLEEDLGINIPKSPEYDTIGGFIFQKTGSIPSKGWKVHLDDVDLEILSSDERSIQKVKVTPRSHKRKKP